jgi:putative salt-induced outer membrane protein
MNLIKKTMASVLIGSLSISSTFADDLFIGTPVAEATSDASAECTANCPGEWTSSVEFGFVKVSGNTDTDSFNGRFSLGYEKDKWRHAGFFATQDSSTVDNIANTETDAKKITAQAKSDYRYTKSAYAFGIVDYDQTKDSGFDHQTSYVMGAGYQIIDSKTHKLAGELGFGIRDSQEELTGDKDSESISRIAGLYKWKISKTANFEQGISTEIGDENTITKSTSSLSANILEGLALKVSYSFKNQSKVPDGNVKKESVTSFTVVYSF